MSVRVCAVVCVCVGVRCVCLGVCVCGGEVCVCLGVCVCRSVCVGAEVGVCVRCVCV